MQEAAFTTAFAAQASKFLLGLLEPGDIANPQIWVNTPIDMVVYPTPYTLPSYVLTALNFSLNFGPGFSSSLAFYLMAM